MVAETESGRYGFVVDEVLGDHQTVIKNLGRFYRHVDLVSGATILGNGTVALILDPHRLVREAIRTMTVGRRPLSTRTAHIRADARASPPSHDGAAGDGAGAEGPLLSSTEKFAGTAGAVQ